MKKNILVFGGVAAVIVSVIMAISMATMACNSADGGIGSMILGYSSMILAFSLIFVAVKNYRDKQNGGVVSFGEAFLMGLAISLIASTCYVVTWAVEYHLFFPDFMDRYTAMQIQSLQKNPMPIEELKTAILNAKMENYNYKTNIFYFGWMTYLEILPVGILITLISALVLRRKRPVIA